MSEVCHQTQQNLTLAAVPKTRRGIMSLFCHLDARQETNKQKERKKERKKDVMPVPTVYYLQNEKIRLYKFSILKSLNRNSVLVIFIQSPRCKFSENSCPIQPQQQHNCNRHCHNKNNNPNVNQIEVLGIFKIRINQRQSQIM